LEKLKASLDKEFEYVDNELSRIGFGNVVKTWLKIERSRLKAKYMVRKRIAWLILNSFIERG
jgi:hypothetical protein